jgi:hypothetical protein
MPAAPLKITASFHADDRVWVAEGSLDDVSIVSEAATYEELRDKLADAVALAFQDRAMPLVVLVTAELLAQ